jgi:hypothetical protein
MDHGVRAPTARQRHPAAPHPNLIAPVFVTYSNLQDATREPPGQNVTPSKKQAVFEKRLVTSSKKQAISENSPVSSSEKQGTFVTRAESKEQGAKGREQGAKGREQRAGKSRRANYYTSPPSAPCSPQWPKIVAEIGHRLWYGRFCTSVRPFFGNLKPATKDDCPSSAILSASLRLCVRSRIDRPDSQQKTGPCDRSRTARRDVVPVWHAQSPRRWAWCLGA